MDLYTKRVSKQILYLMYKINKLYNLHIYTTLYKLAIQKSILRLGALLMKSLEFRASVLASYGASTIEIAELFAYTQNVLSRTRQQLVPHE